VERRNIALGRWTVRSLRGLKCTDVTDFEMIYALLVLC